MKCVTVSWSGRVLAAIGMVAWLAGVSLGGADAPKAPPSGTPEYAAWKAALVGESGGTKTETIAIKNDYMELGCGDYGHWGLTTVAIDLADSKKLIYSYNGSTNGLAVRIDGSTYALGDDESHVTSPLALGGGGTYATIGWTFPEGVVLSARYELVASDSGRADTGRFTYSFYNPPGKATHTVSLKVGLDTKVGDNDAALINTAYGIFDTETGFGVTSGGGADYDHPVPDFWQAFEINAPAEPGYPGTVGQGTFVGGGATRPDKFVIGSYWAYLSLSSQFDFTPSGNKYGDSAVGMWWFDRSLASGSSMSFVVLYGLGRVSTGGTDLRMSVAAPGVLDAAGSNFSPNPFSVNVTLTNLTGRTLTNLPVTVALPAGLSIYGGGSTTQYVASLAIGGTSALSFQVYANPTYGGQTLTYTVTAGAGAPYAVTLSKTIGLPSVLVDCDASLWNFVHLMSTGYIAGRGFPQIVSTVRVDTVAGRSCDLTAANFAVTEDGVPQTLTSVTCASVGGSVADIVIVFDDTGSMSSKITTMKEKATQFASDIVAVGVDAHFGLVSFGDKAEVDFDLNLTSNVANFQAAVSALVADGGDDYPESPLDAIMLALRDMTWRLGSQRIFVVITDASVHTLSDASGKSDYDMAPTIAAVKAMGGSVFAVGPNLGKGDLLGNDGKSAKAKAYGAANDIKTLAVDTGGYWQNIDTADFGAFVDEIVHVITSLYTVTYSTSDTARDGLWRKVIVTVTDPTATLPIGKTSTTGLTDCDDGTYQAPYGGFVCDQGEDDFVHVMAVGYAASYIFPEITATVRVDSAAGRACELTKSNFAAAEDGVWQTITSVSCAGTAGSVADIVICFDDTSSMSGQIGTMKAKATAFVNQITARRVNARFALVSFKDDEMVDQDFITDVAVFQSKINALAAEGGGDMPETSFDAVLLALTDLTWRAEAQKIIVVITDAPSHYRGDGTAYASTTLAEVQAACIARGASVFAVGPVLAKGTLTDNQGKPVVVEAPKTTTRPDDIRLLAEGTGGFWQDIYAAAGFGAFVDHIVDVVASLYTVIYTTSNSASDGSYRAVVIQVTDPVEGTDCDDGIYQAPLAPATCVNGQGNDFVNVMAVGYATSGIFPQITATVRVDSEAGRACALTRANFALTEDGTAQAITSVTCSGTAGSVADIVICFDDTGSMGDEIGVMKTKATAFVNDIAAGGVDARFALISFKDVVTLRQGFTANVATFNGAIGTLAAAEGDDAPEASLDAVMLALTLGWRPGAQKLIIVITDNASHYLRDGTAFSNNTMDGVIAAVNAAGAAVFAIAPTAVTKALSLDNYGKPLASKTGLTHENDIRVLADSTGGFWQAIGTDADFGTFIDRIVEVVTSLYTVTYTTSNWALDGTWREVIISVTDPDKGTDCDDGTYVAPLECQRLVVEPTEISASCLTGGPAPASQTFRLKNSCTGTLHYTISEGEDWLSVSSTGGTATGADWNNVTVSFSTAGLPAGEYVGEITVDSGHGGTQVVTVNLHVLDLYVVRSFPAGCHSPGDLIEVSLSIYFGGVGSVTALAVFETLPDGWTFPGWEDGITSSPTPDVAVVNPETGILEITWALVPIPALPHVLKYLVRAPSFKTETETGSYGRHCFTGFVDYRTDGPTYTVPTFGEQCVELQDCTVPCTTHQADQNRDGIIQLSPDLTRMIQFYNRRGYHSQAGTEDGYAPVVGATSGAPHQADQNGDWVIQLSPDLTRMIQFFNSGGYHCQEGTEDGFAPGLVPRKSVGEKGTLSSVRSFGSDRYPPGNTLDVTVTLTHSTPTALSSLAVQETLPTGWTFNRVVSTPPSIRPMVAGATGTLGFAWLSIPSSWPVNLTYRVNVPASATGAKVFAGAASFREDAGENPVPTTGATSLISNEVTVTFAHGAGGSILEPTPQTIFYGGNITGTAVPDYCFVFTQWDNPVTTTNPLVLTNVVASVTRTASFRAATLVLPPNGNFTAVKSLADVTGGQGLWDLTGPYTTTVGGRELTLAVVHDTRGRLTGTATLNVTIGKAVVPVRMPIRGSVSGANGALVATLTMQGTGAANSVRVLLGLRLTLANTGGAWQLVGPATGSVATGGTPAVPIVGPATLLLPTAMTGAWTLQFRLTPEARTVTGTATLKLSDDDDASYLFDVRGRIRGQMVEARLTGQPSDVAAKGISITTTLTPLEGGWARLNSFSIRGYGQSLHR